MLFIILRAWLDWDHAAFCCLVAFVCDKGVHAGKGEDLFVGQHLQQGPTDQTQQSEDGKPLSLSQLSPGDGLWTAVVILLTLSRRMMP